MDMLESKFRRVREMVSGATKSRTNVATSAEPKTRPSVTWADRKEKTSPRPFRRFQQSFRSRETSASSSAVQAGRNGPSPSGAHQLDNRPSTPSKFRRFFHAVGQQQPPNSPSCASIGRQSISGSNFLEPPTATSTFESSSSPEDNRPNRQRQDLDSQDNLNPTTTTMTPPAISRSVSPNLAAKVLFSRQVSVNFGNYDGDDEMCYGENDFVVECLQWHNVFRERHQAPPLVLSPQLCQSAQCWANTLGHNEMFYSSNPQDRGENLFTRSSCDPDYDVTGRETAVSWYSGIKQYNFNGDRDLLHVNAGQFTQMVWRESTQLGVGKARTRGGKVLVVAHYRPQGNVFRRFKENVLPERAANSSTSSSVDDEEEEDDDQDEEDERLDEDEDSIVTVEICNDHRRQSSKD